MQPAQEDADVTWRVVKEWSGGRGVEHELELFTPPSRGWRIAYKTTASASVPTGLVDVVVRSKDHKMVTAAYNLKGGVSGILIVPDEESEYYLDVRSYGPDWWVAVEQSQQ